MNGINLYFARDSYYSADKMFSLPDSRGLQYTMACRVVVGEFCLGVANVLTPDVR
jgi:hypothetical protein